MMKEGKIRKVGIMKESGGKGDCDIKAEAVEISPRTDDDDYSAYLDVAHYEADAVAKI